MIDNRQRTLTNDDSLILKRVIPLDVYYYDKAILGKDELHTSWCIPGWQLNIRQYDKAILGIVQDTYELVQMRKLCEGVEYNDEFQRLTDVSVEDTYSRNGAYVCREYVIKFHDADQYKPYAVDMPEVGTKMGMVLRIVNGYDGQTPVRIGFGSIVLACKNGMMSYKHSHRLVKRHTSGVKHAQFHDIISECFKTFVKQVHWNQKCITIPTDAIKVAAFLDMHSGMSKRKVERLTSRFVHETEQHGKTVYALVNALTYYASHNSDEFPINKSSEQNVTSILHARQEEVYALVTSARFNGYFSVSTTSSV